ncbi:MAG: winged helix-turn-helix domain-containing protein, partial [Proteobacteria bacterium]|nr:winged helix-turn-helix domain-containing protein [Pseudomonadota bacterium]
MIQKEIIEQQPFYIGNWLVSPAKNQIQNSSITKAIQPKLIEVLTFLCSKHNEIISADELIKQCWPNQFISDNPIHKCIAQLRKALGDSSKHPKYIATIPKRGYSVIAKVSKLNNQLKPIKPYWLEFSPFKGLRKYTSSEHSIFFGRTKAITDILSLIDQNQRGSTALIMVLGQSGCGKSSLVQAGILPKLINPYKPFKNQYVKSYIFVAESSEYKSVDKSLMSFLYDNKILSNSYHIEKYHKHLGEDFETLKDYIGPAVISEQQDHESKVLVIFIDQLECIFSGSASSKSIEKFFKIITALLASKKCLIIAALRNEYYQELTESHSYIKIRPKAYHYDVPPLSYDEICDIVRKPAQAAGLTYQLGLENQIPLDTFLINKAQSIKVNLPILQHTLSELYKNRNDNVLSYSVYENNGGMEGGLSTMAENTFLDLPAKAQLKFEQLLHNLIQINPDGKDLAVCKKVVTKLIDDADLKNIIEIFTDKRLFKTQWINGESYLSITHDILIKNWPRLQLWVEKNTVLLNTQHEVKIATNRWLHHKKNKDFLFNSQQPILAANNITNTYNVNLNSDEKEFIVASNAKFS